jgi:glycosyltransferase involved in cell wall biosynthesis
MDAAKRLTKLVIQIPCYNEEQSLGTTLRDLPRTLPGVDVIEWLVVDDGSKDRTAEVARTHGVDHIVRLPRHRGLAYAFLAGLDASLAVGADLIVNTDADNQYCAADIPALIAPLLEGRAELVIGARPIRTIAHFSPMKKALQGLGSWIVRVVSKTAVPDAASGFRAMSREAAMRLHVFNEFSYTLETIIQAGQQGMAVSSVPVRTNPDLRPSRLVKSISSYLRRQGLTVVRIFVTYKPFPSFAVPGALLSVGGLLLALRFLGLYVAGYGSGHVQSLILAALLMGAGFFLIVVGLLADLISVNRKLLEKLDWRLQQVEEAFRRASPGEPCGRGSSPTEDSEPPVTEPASSGPNGARRFRAPSADANLSLPGGAGEDSLAAAASGGILLSNRRPGYSCEFNEWENRSPRGS